MDGIAVDKAALFEALGQEWVNRLGYQIHRRAQSWRIGPPATRQKSLMSSVSILVSNFRGHNYYFFADLSKALNSMKM